MMRKFMMALLAMTMIFSSGVVTAEEDQKESLKIGFGGALLGNLASYGLSSLYGLEYVVLKTNAEGGLLGQQIEIVKEDDGCDPALASSAATKLAGHGIKVVLGHTCSGATSSALSAYNNQALLISASATEVGLTEDGKNPYFFRTIMRDDAQADLQVDFIKKRGYKKVAIIHDKGDYGKALADRAKTLLTADENSNAEVVMFEGVTTGQISYDAVVSKLKNSEADVLLWGGYYSDASKLANQMRAKKVDTIIIGADGLKNPQYIKMAGEASEGTFATGPSDLSSGSTPPPAVTAALEDHRMRYKTEEIGPYFFYSIAAAQALFAAIEKAGSTTDLEAIKMHLQNNPVETIMGEVSFNAKGDIVGAEAVMYEVKDGDFVEVKM